jgi:hypothetical protein
MDPAGSVNQRRLTPSAIRCASMVSYKRGARLRHWLWWTDETDRGLEPFVRTPFVKRDRVGNLLKSLEKLRASTAQPSH